MAKCFFCSKQITEGKGAASADHVGNIKNFCSSKCRKNWKMKRDSKRIKWAKIREIK